MVENMFALYLDILYWYKSTWVLKYACFKIKWMWYINMREILYLIFYSGLQILNLCNKCMSLAIGTYWCQILSTKLSIETNIRWK